MFTFLPGYLYYTDWSLQPHIGRVGLDGSNRTQIINSKLGSPNGLTMCHITKRLFWVDTKLHLVEFSDRNGTNRQQLPLLRMPHPFGITVFEDFIYWTDWQTKSINKAHKWTGAQQMILYNSSQRLMGIQVGDMNVCNLCCVCIW